MSISTENRQTIKQQAHNAFLCQFMLGSVEQFTGEFDDFVIAIGKTPRHPMIIEYWHGGLI
jgi:hypothetical protein